MKTLISLVSLALVALALAGASRAAPADDVAALSWIAGSWVMERDGSTVREIWLAPRDGAMGGVGQTSRPGKAAHFEFMSITAEPEGATYTARIPGQDPTPFRLKSGGKPGEAVFENLDHDFPQRVIYRRCGGDICARVEGMVDGKLEGEDFRYQPAP